MTGEEKDLSERILTLERCNIRLPRNYDLMLPADLEQWVTEQEGSEKFLKAREDARAWAAAEARRAARRIQVDGARLRDLTDRACAAVVRSNDPPWIFVRSGHLSRVVRDEKGIPRIAILDEGGIRHAMERAADFVKVRVRSRVVEEEPVHPPLPVVEDFMAEGEWPEIPPLSGIIECPAILPDNSLIITPGYHPATRLYYAPDPGLTLPPIPDRPGPEDMAAAVALLRELFQDFPFVSEADRANCYAALLTAVLRPMIYGNAPLALFDKPTMGTGATLAARVILAISTGRDGPLQSAPEENEEWGKSLHASLLSGRPVVVFDNLEGKLYSPVLALVLTTSSFEHRVLGKSMNAAADTRATWIATGNNVQLGGDLPRRCYWIRMDAPVARPWQRDGFQHPLPEWALQERGRILAAVLTMARAWILAGRPVPKDLPLVGGFEGWRDTSGGILHTAGVPGFLGNLEELYKESDTDTEQWDAFLTTWAAHWPGKQPVTVHMVIAHMKAEGDEDQRSLTDPETRLCDTLPDWIDLQDKGLSRKLGKALARIKDRVFPCGLVLRKVGLEHKAVKWVVREK